MEPIDLTIDATRTESRREAVRVLAEAQREVASLTKGFHRLELSVIRYRPRRSDRQNKYYWPCFVQPFGNYLRVDKPHFTDEMAHEVLKRMFLEVSEYDTRTGLVLTYVRSTTELSTVEFNDYLDKVAATLATDCGFAVPDPNVYRERDEVAA